MKTYIILAAIFLSSFIDAYSQNSIDMIKMLNIEHEIDTLEDRISKFVEINYPEMGNTHDLQQFHVFRLSPDFGYFEKEDLLNYSFLYKLNFGYYELPSKVTKIGRGCKVLFFSKIYSKICYWIKPIKWQEYIRTSTYVTDSIGNLVAYGDAGFVFFPYPTSYLSHQEQEFAKMFFKKEIDFAFILGDALSSCICIKDDELFVVEILEEGLKKYEWNEFVDCHFEKWKSLLR